MAILDNVKTALRIKNTAYDAEITSFISACKIDLSIGGVKIIEETDALTEQAIKLYCKANFGYEENSEKFAQAYTSLKHAMALCGDYNTEVT